MLSWKAIKLYCKYRYIIIYTTLVQIQDFRGGGLRYRWLKEVPYRGIQGHLLASFPGKYLILRFSKMGLIQHSEAKSVCYTP